MLFTEHAFVDRIAAAAEAGFEAVECQFPDPFASAGAVRTALRTAGLRMVSLNASPGDAARGELGLGVVAGAEDRFARSMDEAIDYALAVDCPVIHCMSGNAAADEAEGAVRSRLVANLRGAADACAARGLTVVIEPMNRIDRPAYWLQHPDQAAGVIAEVGRPNLGMLFDAYHVGKNGLDVLCLLDRHGPVIRHMQIAGVPHRHEPDDPAWVAALFGRIDAGGYGGWVGCEYNPRGATGAGLGWLSPYRPL